MKFHQIDDIMLFSWKFLFYGKNTTENFHNNSYFCKLLYYKIKLSVCFLLVVRTALAFENDYWTNEMTVSPSQNKLALKWLCSFSGLNERLWDCKHIFGMKTLKNWWRTVKAIKQWWFRWPASILDLIGYLESLYLDYERGSGPFGNYSL